MTKAAPGPWKYVPSTECHGPYVTSEFGTTICDCYVMGGPNHPIHFMGDLADQNARLIAAAPEMLEALKDALEAIAWHDGLQFEPTGRKGQTIEQIVEHAIATADGQS